MRRARPALWNRVDEDASAISVAADPRAVPDAIKETEATPLSPELMTARDTELDPLAADRLRAKGQTSPTGRPGE